jgi:hypothetical protein
MYDESAQDGVVVAKKKAITKEEKERIMADLLKPIPKK